MLDSHESYMASCIRAWIRALTLMYRQPDKQPDGGGDDNTPMAISCQFTTPVVDIILKNTWGAIRRNMVLELLFHHLFNFFNSPIRSMHDKKNGRKQ
jgi:hypothetical protein